MKRPLAVLALLAWVAFLTGCASSPHYATHELTLYETNQSPLATLHLMLPRNISTNWSDGQWCGELSANYVRPQKQVLFASDMLKASAWQKLRCRIDFDDPGLIRINLQPDQPEDHVNVWMPVKKHSRAESSWYHWTDAGGFEGGPVRIVQR